MKARTISRDGVRVTDKGNYFLVVFEAWDKFTLPKSPNAFSTAEEVLDWYTRGSF